MTAQYFSHSPRGFANEITIYAVEKTDVRDWVQWFEMAYGCEYPNGHPLTPITRKQAERLLRRDGVVLQIDGGEDEWLIGEGLSDTLNPESIKSACNAARAICSDWSRMRAFETEMAAAYPEFAR